MDSTSASASSAADSAALTSEDICAQLSRILFADAASSSRTWRLEVATSSLTAAGDGVFLRGHCAAGAVLAIYPGVTFSADDLPAMHKMILPGNEYVLMRRDGILIDGRPDGPSRQLYEVAKRRDLAAGAAPLIEDGELGVGNKVNHPPSGAHPNVHVHPFDLRPGEHAPLHPYVPVVNFRPPADGEACKQTVVLVASRELRDEELLLNYKLRQEGPLESWYAPVAGTTAAHE